MHLTRITDHSTRSRSRDFNKASSSNSSEDKSIITNISAQSPHQESVEELTNKLPFDILLLLFSWLPVRDLITVRRVCHSWRVAAQDEYIWKNHILTMHGKPRDVRNVKLMPAIKKIRGHADIKLLNIILENVDKLTRLNVHFEPPVSSSQVTVILEKYPFLESITLCSCKPDIIECLEKLKASNYLKQIIFVDVCNFVSPCLIVSALNIFQIFTDCNNFPALTELNISGNRDFTSAFWMDASFRNIVSDIITKRSQQLITLKLDIGCADSSDVLNAVSSCVKLQTLLILIRPFNSIINLAKINELRSLHLYSFREDKTFNTSLQNSLERGTWAHLVEVDISLHNSEEYNAAILRAIISNAKQLKMLRYRDYENFISEQQLEDINSLLKLESLYISGFENISEETIGYITECHSLKKLELRSRSLSIHNEHPCIISLLLQLNNLIDLLIRDGDHHGEEVGNIFLQFKNRKSVETYLHRMLHHS